MDSSARILSFEWKPSTTEFIERRPKEKKPSSSAKEYKRKPDGRIVWMVPKDAQYIMTVESEEGELYTENVYSYIKNVNSKIRITKNFREKFELYMYNQRLTVDEKGFIRGIERTIRCFLAENNY